jgi:hypothetical protein
VIQSLSRIFLLSPAHCGGKRAGYLLNDTATFELARRIRTRNGAPLADVFSFLSGLYFRGKVAYAQAFASSPAGVPAAYAITSNRGLLPIDEPLTVAALRDFGCVDINAADPRYRAPLERDAGELASRLGDEDEVVLLGSVATGKYVDVLLDVFGGRLRFPAEFAGRGDMSRGGLMLRCVDERRELTYVPIRGAARRGKRPPKLERRRADDSTTAKGPPDEGRRHRQASEPAAERGRGAVPARRAPRR